MFPHPSLTFPIAPSLRPLLSLTSAWRARAGESLSSWRSVVEWEDRKQRLLVFWFLDIRAGLELVTTVLPQFPECWGYRCRAHGRRFPNGESLSGSRKLQDRGLPARLFSRHALRLLLKPGEGFFGKSHCSELITEGEFFSHFRYNGVGRWRVRVRPTLHP